MPTWSLSHEENRKRVCAVCIKKIKKGKERTLTQNLKWVIAFHIYPRFHQDEDYLPCSLCTTCQVILLENVDSKTGEVSGKPSRPMPNHDYAGLVKEMKGLPRQTREQSAKEPKCRCEICTLATQTLRITPSKYLAPVAPQPQPLEEDDPLCPKCLKPILRQNTHRCGAKSRRYKKVVENFSPEGLKSLQVYLNKELGGYVEKSKCKVPIETLEKCMVRLKMSQNQVIEMTRILKEDVAVKFEEYYTTKLSKKSHTLDDFFEAREVQLFSKGAHESEDDNGSTELALEKTTGIFCHNLPGLINHVVRERNIKEPFYKIGCDGGQGSLKLTLSILEKAQDANAAGDTKGAKILRGKAADKYKFTGVKRLFIIGLIPFGYENYENMRIILDQLELDKIDFNLSTDFKLINILCGMQNHKATHPCPYCLGSRTKDEDFLDGDDAPLRTLGKLEEDATNFQMARRPKAKDFNNTVKLPLIKGSPNAYILDIVLIPGLHINLGITNKVIEVISMEWKEGDLLNLLKDLGVIHSKKKRPNECNGPEADKLVSRIPRLRDALPANLHHYLDILIAFRDVKQACFSKHLSKDWEACIQIFRDMWEEAGLPIIPKVHALFRHVPEVCMKYEEGLGDYSEQALEACHCDFKDHNKKYFRVPGTKDYAKKMLDSVVSYNSLRI